MSFDALLINTSNLIRLAIEDFGETSETAEADVKCRIEYSNRIVRNFKGEEVVSLAKIFYPPDTDIDELTLVEFDGRRHGILRIDRPQDSKKQHHLEVYVN